MVFSEFADLIGPPRQAPVDVDWAAVESWLRVKLPGDYKEVASEYGPLDIGDAIWLYTPFRDEVSWDWDYTRWLKTTHRECRSTARLDVPAEVPAFHPARGGLLAWGRTRRGAPLFWDTSVSSDPDEWTTVMFHREFPYVGNSPWHRYDMSMTEFLVTAIQTGIDPGTRWGLGPLPPWVRRPVFLGDLQRWVAPARRSATKADAQRRAALRKGRGLDTLSVLVPPPGQPYLGGVTWDEVAEQVGSPLPVDYRALMERYGAGEWRGWLGFFALDELAQRVQVLGRVYRDLRDQFPEFYPLPAWPEPGGFLPFAMSVDGDQLGWLTIGSPDAWLVLLVPRDGGGGYPWRGGLVDTLLSWSRGASPQGMPSNDPLDDLLELATFTATDNSGR